MLLGEGGRLGDGRVGGDRDHLGARGHHALHAEAGEADHALQHELLLRVQLARVAARAHDEPQLLGAEVLVGLDAAVDAEQGGDGPAALVEQPDRRAEDGAEEPQRADDQQGDALGVLQRDALRRQLARDDVQRGDHDEGDDHGGGVRADRAEGGVEQAGERGLADPAEREAGEGDPELAGGDVAVEVADAVVDVARAGRPLGEELLDARAPHGDERELGRDEEAVEQDEEEDGEQAAANFEHSALPGHRKVTSVLQPAPSGAGCSIRGDGAGYGL